MHALEALLVLNRWELSLGFSVNMYTNIPLAWSNKVILLLNKSNVLHCTYLNWLYANQRIDNYVIFDTKCNDF
jgi:ABC-type sulfate transport system substrate-binding protein